ncbi:MAG: formate--tetrahydrofolate ligase [Deltaproteobacteria bacterium]|nr:formate--tetrahydrofolate ligase [Deltaproteobacteria bacterium]
MMTPTRRFYLDPRENPDWKIAEAAEAKIKSIYQIRDELGLLGDELLPHGNKIAKVDYPALMSRIGERRVGKYIDVTAITPTPLGEGKSTTVMGLVDGLAYRGKRASAAIRQPSGGPTFNIKGSAAGGGMAQCIPLAPFSLGLTGDIDKVVNAHNLMMVALTSRIQHEAINTDEFLSKKGLRRLDIDPRDVRVRWVMDFCAQSLRHIVIGLGEKLDGAMMETGFDIAVSSELMAILAVARSLADMREMIGRVVVGRDRRGRNVTTRDLEVDGAMAAWLVDALNPNLMQTIGGNPVFVHAGPFANIAIGQSSIVADLIALRLTDFHVTESGFGADIGFEKFWNLKCRISGLKPDAAVIVATIRALKMHGGGPSVVPGKKLDPAYTKENLGLLEKGLENLVAHIEIVKRSGINPVVCVNHFESDTVEELRLVERTATEAGARVAVSRHWLLGGEGASDLADAVIDACREPSHFEPLYPAEMSHVDRIEKIAREVYGADGVVYLNRSDQKLKELESDPGVRSMGTCMVKSHLSLSHDPDLKGRPRGWRLPIRDILVFYGARFVVPVAGDIKLMPGTASDPAFRRIDVDVDTGKITGLF